MEAPIIRICSFILASALALTGGSPAFAAKPTDEERAMDGFVAARIAEIEHRNSEAIKLYLKLHAATPDSEVVSDRLLTSAVRAGDLAAAVRAVRAQQLQGERSDEGPLVLYTDAFKRKNWPMALLAAKQLEESYFGFMAPLLRAWIDVAQRKSYTLEQADADKDPYLAYYSSDQRIYLDLATGELAKAKLSLRSFALSNTGFARDLLIRAAPVYGAKGDCAFASAIMSGVSDSGYANAAARTKAGSADATILPHEGLGALHVRIAVTLLDQKNSEAALIFARLANWLDPANQSAKLAIADALAGEDLVQAAQALRLSVPVSSPYWPQANSDATRQYHAVGDPDAALEVALDARKARPTAANAALLLAQAYDNAGQSEAAAKIYRQIVDDADNARAGTQQRAIYRLLLATVLEKQGDWAGAQAFLEAAVKLDPDNPTILNYLGYSLLERRVDIARGTELVTKAHSLAPQSPAITDSLGWAKYLQGQYAEAIPLLERAVQAGGSDSTINEHLGDAYWQVGRRIDARYAWRVAANAAEGEAAARLAQKLDVGIMPASQNP